MTKICEIDGAILDGEKSLYDHDKIHLQVEYKCKLYEYVQNRKT